MKIGYARVSTEDQNLGLQLDALKAAGCDRIFHDQGVSGVTIERDGLSQAILATGQGDVLVVWKLDRLGRSLSFLVDLIEKLRTDGAGFQSLSDNIDTTTAGGKLIFHIMAALAEFERALIAERTRHGMRAAQRRGKAIGRPVRLTQWQVDQAQQLLAAGKHTVPDVAALLNVSVSTMRRGLRDAEGGRQWIRGYRKRA